jgi:hypothetical protein
MGMVEDTPWTRSLRGLRDRHSTGLSSTTLFPGERGRYNGEIIQCSGNGEAEDGPRGANF